MSYRRARRTSKRRYRTVTLRSKLKSERRKTAGKVLLIGTVIGVLAFGSVQGWKAVSSFLFESERFKIRRIDIVGAKNVTKGEIEAQLSFRTGDNIFTAWVSKSERDLRQCKPELKKVSVRRGWKKIVVRIEERTPVAFVSYGGEKLGIDSDNRPFPLRGRWVKHPLPEITAPGELERAELLRFVKDFYSQAGDFSSRAAGFGIESLNEITIRLKDGPLVVWGRRENDKLSAKLDRLQQVLDDGLKRYSGLEYVNLAFFDDGRIIVRPKRNG
ncbi:MAG TPA: hypothetical protein DEE98_08095 [Elusimicrobia bacterium]|nr:MAG: hypothetical protein A2278_09300 [Elusimicrobia bacterium RIFOXYA12_FULL_49_49]OGS14979.1 MAG: hypothetical protein A2251_08155 [Elusimicrobia bacterium RIFOXYA2_FULL_47_53]OGS26086.1 MAG: hypothetical protein A2339_02120 [Elusimicrobia bacterium RIFOXYB12_FULL_50_12]OGS29323.1 MAG: hypothetical protein A2323_04085 [Elusimicrobia bacterium RIFOXYB2_FULL_46_23]HBU70324.1 hypothetical protein [Elusimicrobiota bacterium]